MGEVLTTNSTNVRTTVRPSSAARLRGQSAPAQLRLLRASMAMLESASPALAARWAEVLFRMPRRHRMPAREREWIASAWPLRLGEGRDRVHTWSWGEGPTVVLAHGWEGRGSQMGALAMALAGAGFRAVALDGPAHGASGRRLSSLPQMAAAIARVARHLGPVRAVVAHSFGAAATSWAVGSGELAAERLALVAPGADLQSYIREFGARLGVSAPTTARMVRNLERRLAFSWEEGRRPALAGAARAPHLPVLVVHDRDDDEVPWRDGEAVAAAWPRGELWTTSGLGHRRILRDPAVAARVAAFVAGAA
jgi:pimeloyl-ACP methyl ester carboxylesterase